MTAIYMSLEPVWALGVSVAAKDHEFRKRLPAKPFTEWFIYVTQPVGMLKYVATVAPPIQSPSQIDPKGFGNIEFNKGQMTKFAIPIIGLDELVTPIGLDELRTRFNFTPPQFFAYDSAYQALTHAIVNAPRKIIFRNTQKGILCYDKGIRNYWNLPALNLGPVVLSDKLRQKKCYDLRRLVYQSKKEK